MISISQALTTELEWVRCPSCLQTNCLSIRDLASNSHSFFYLGTSFDSNNNVRIGNLTKNHSCHSVNGAYDNTEEEEEDFYIILIIWKLLNCSPSSRNLKEYYLTTKIRCFYSLNNHHFPGEEERYYKPSLFLNQRTCPEVAEKSAF